MTLVSPNKLSLILLEFGFFVSLARRVICKSGLGPTAEILSLRKPSLVFALRASLTAVQIRSRRICASPKESIQRKGHPDAAYSLCSSLLNGVAERGFLPLRQRDASMHRPYGLLRSKAAVLGAVYGRKPYLALDVI
ncbi:MULTISPECIES: hypothetical protein [Methylomonas]|uniref:Secreted protein n=1 Tax=Methylomonas defluvii TaxID=3045149 RepID=A0ABU4UC53_9GAMM|nr:MULTISPECIES: hypothetical protein [unclassified Methylomonas]MDX8127037.1 hypothetical protein [Methylomonas sp. OY6]